MTKSVRFQNTRPPRSPLASFFAVFARFSARAALAGGAVALVAGACGGNTPKLHALAEPCSLNSDCEDPYLCALGKCRAQCVTSADCDDGGSCVTDNHDGVCLTANEANAPCEAQTDCPAPLACSTDYRCHNLCQSDVDCNVLGVHGRLCETDQAGVNYCVDASSGDSGQGGAGADTSTSTVDGAAGEAGAGPTIGVIGPSGGTFGIAGVTITIPPGALDHDIAISISPISSPIPGSLGQAYEIGPSGTLFLQPVILTFGYTDEELSNEAAGSFAVSTTVGKSWQSVSAPVTDPFAHTISGTISHLSPYALAPYGASITGSAGSGNQGEGGTGSGGRSTATAGSSSAGAMSGTAGAGVASNCVAAPSGLVSWWRAEGTPADELGKNNGQVSGQVTYIAGKFGQAFQFQSTGFVVASATTGLPSGTADRTLEAWVLMPRAAPANTEIIFFYGSQATPSNDFSEINGGLRGPDNTTTLFNTAPRVNTNTWIHVAYTLSAGVGTLYVNGQSRATAPTSTSNTPANGSLYIGGFPAAADTQWFAGGAVDELSIYDRALSSDEISAIYGAVGGKCVN